MNSRHSSLSLAFLRGIGVLVVVVSQAASGNGMHPEVPLRDSQENLVVESGLPMSTMQTCGGDCHDTAYIMQGSDHADAGASRLGKGVKAHDWQQGNGYFGGWDPLSYDLDGLESHEPTQSPFSPTS